MADYRILGIHHVTAICGDAQRNVDFYTGTLGLRLVKLTVNFDDPGAYHFYYGDSIGSPGTIITFFNYPRGSTGARGAGAFMCTTFAIPTGSLDFWKDRLEPLSVEHYTNAHGEHMLTVEDPDGLRLQFIERPYVNRLAWPHGGVNADHAIMGIDAVTLGTRTNATIAFIQAALDLDLRLESPLQSGKTLTRYEAGVNFLDVLPTEHRSLGGRGTIHHVAWRVADDAVHADWRQRLMGRNAPVSEIKDRDYFKSIYFREPGGALLEIATDGPGFTIDEPVEQLGSELRLPQALRGDRDRIEAALPRLKLPVATL